MTNRKRLWTEEELRVLLEESDEDDQEISEQPTELSDSEEDGLETASDGDDEQILSDNDTVSDSGQVLENTCYVGTDGTQWNKLPFPQGKTPARNLIRGSISKVKLPPGKHIESTYDAFSLFITDQVIQIIVESTNLYGSEKRGTLWHPTDAIEIRCFIGLLVNAGVNKQGVSDLREFWHPLFGNVLFRVSMSCNRFMLIFQYIRFDDKSTRTARRIRDKFAPLREIWEIINTNLLKHYIPGENITIDEQLVPFRGRVSFKQYIPSKPDKYGMKIWWICDSSNSYPLKGIPYLGKEGYQRGTNLASNVVEELCAPFFYSNRNVTFDNYFTSFELAQRLLSVGLTCVGTLRKNKTCIPPNFLPNRQREAESNIFGYRKNLTMVSYVPKKNRAVILLSSMHHDDKIAAENHNKSDINLHYNSTNGGVDTLDQLCHAFTSKRKTNRWPLAQFFNIIDVTGVASKIIWLNIYPDWNANKKNTRRKLFLQSLIQELVMPNIQRRSTAHLSAVTKRLMTQVLSSSTSEQEPGEAEQSSKSTKKRRCYMCNPAIGRMNRQLCNICRKNVCNEHSEKVTVCNGCVNK